jgi:hypothetical protein
MRIITGVDLLAVEPESDDINQLSGEFVACVKGGETCTKCAKEGVAPGLDGTVKTAEKWC